MPAKLLASSSMIRYAISQAKVDADTRKTSRKQIGLYFVTNGILPGSCQEEVGPTCAGENHECSTSYSGWRTLEQRVERLLCRWRTETAVISSSTQITAHPAYQEIITLGEAAVPFLFRDMERTQDGHLSKALAAITGNNPVPLDQRGQIRKIAGTWLSWAKERG